MSLTWVSIAASLLMGMGAALLFAVAVKRNYFRDLEDAKYQVFWSDLEEETGHHARPDDKEKKHVGNGG